MGLASIILLILLIFLAIAALKFLMGAARTIVSFTLFILAALLLVSFLTGSDFLGVGAAITGILP
jgi:hypothetical protein